MHDANVDLLSPKDLDPQDFNIQRGAWGLFVGTLVLFSNLAAQAATQIVSEQAQTLEHAAEVMHTTSTFNTITAVSGFIVCVFSMIRFVVDMYDRFKPTQKRGAKPMPGDGKNPKFNLVKSAKAVIAPVKKPNGWVFLLGLLVALAMFAYIVLAFIAPKVDIPPLVAVVIICIAGFILAFKHAPRA